jgi:DNA-binding helix-hairpin-helix protein with protein kinase domain
MKNFIGQDGFVWWIGIVEDIDDPLTLGRCKVRCFGYHPAKKDGLVPTEDLPWALAIHPVNTPNLYGTPKAGDWVFGFFLDAVSAQEPAILGYLPAIPEAASEYFGTASSLTRNFANVVNKNDVLWDVNNASIKISADTNLTLNGKSNLTLSIGAQTVFAKAPENPPVKKSIRN